METSAMFVTNALTGGGAERASNVIVNALSELEFEVVLVSINAGGRDFIELKCPSYELNRPWPGSLFSTVIALFKLQILVIRLKPKVLVLNCDLPEFLGSLVLFKGRRVIVEHASQPWEKRLLLGKIVRRLLRKKNSKWVAVSPHLLIWPFNTAPDQVINNPVIQPEKPTMEEQEIFSSPRLIHIGRLIPSKQPNWCLEVAMRLERECIFLGAGPLENELKTLSEIESVDATFHGFVKDPWVHVKEGDLVLVTSKSEGDGLVVIEAILHQRPFLVFDTLDFKKFNLPSDFLCNSIDEFELKASQFFSGVLKLHINREFRQQLITQRDPKVVASQWIKFFTIVAS
jgi:glycosyltransferase involved in cell wall biosynthesis